MRVSLVLDISVSLEKVAFFPEFLSLSPPLRKLPVLLFSIGSACFLGGVLVSIFNNRSAAAFILLSVCCRASIAASRLNPMLVSCVIFSSEGGGLVVVVLPPLFVSILLDVEMSGLILLKYDSSKFCIFGGESLFILCLFVIDEAVVVEIGCTDAAFCCL